MTCPLRVWIGLALFSLVLLSGNVRAEDAPVSDGAEEANPLMDLFFPETPDYDMPPLQPNLTLFLFTLILFVAFVFFMRTTTWQPLIKGLDAREARVVQAEKDAEAARAEAKRLQVETEAKLAAVQEQVRDIVAEARKKAETEKQKIVSDAQAEAERVKQEALAEITSARESALSELSAQVDAQVAAATEHVVGRVL